MKVFANEHPGEIVDLGDGTYYETSNIVESTDPDTGQQIYSYDVVRKLWPTTPAVPEEVYAWRLRLSTQIAGLKPVIDGLLGQLPEPDKTVATEAWNHGVTIRRDSPLVAQMTGALGLPAEQVDELFVQANAIAI